MDNEMDKEQEVPAEQGIQLDKKEKDDHDHHSHAGHGHEQSEEIVLHQEKLLPTILLATSLVILTLFGLHQAGGTKFDISSGKAAFDKVETEKIELIKKAAPLNKNNMNIDPKHENIKKKKKSQAIEAEIGH